MSGLQRQNFFCGLKKVLMKMKGLLLQSCAKSKVRHITEGCEGWGECGVEVGRRGRFYVLICLFWTPILIYELNQIIVCSHVPSIKWKKKTIVAITLSFCPKGCLINLTCPNLQLTCWEENIPSHPSCFGKCNDKA